MPLFGLLILERDAYQFADFLGLVQAYLCNVGGFLTVGMILYCIFQLVSPDKRRLLSAPNTSSGTRKADIPAVMLYMTAAAILLYAVYAILYFNQIGPDVYNLQRVIDPTGYNKVYTPKFSLADVKFGFAPRDLDKARNMQPLVLTLAGLCAFVGVLVPMLQAVARVKFGRVWAIAKLSFLEVIRNRVFLVMLLPLIPLLFPLSWFFPQKAEDELRTSISGTAFIIEVVVLLLAALVTSFALPNDVKNQNIYTIVTKPVERIEILFGRFIGYGAFVTVGLLALSLISLVITEAATLGMSEKAKQVTHKARVPVRAKLKFESRRGEVEGIDVGREFNYRKYLGGDPSSSMRGVYTFRNLPGGLANGKDRAVPVEFTFDIYKLTKGEENRGVDIGVRVTSWRCKQTPPSTPGDGTWKWADSAEEQRYRDRAIELLLQKVDRWKGKTAKDITDPSADVADAKPGTPEWEVADTLAKEFGYFEVNGKEIFDYEASRVLVPAGLFEHANAGKDAAGNALKPPTDGLLTVAVRCTTPSQMLGMAEGDLYLIESEQLFWVNFLKAKFGDWCWLMIVVGLAICLSTYLDGVVTLIVTVALFVTGFFNLYLEELAFRSGKDGSGPARALDQILQAKQPTAVATGSTVEQTADVFDVVFGWVIRQVIHLFPDVNNYSSTMYLSEGFDISLETMAMNFLAVAAYLFPWFVLAYFLLRDREVAA